MTEANELDRAHSVGMELLDTIHEYWKLGCQLESGMPADDPRLDDITRFRARLRTGLVHVESKLSSQLPEFACVNERPVTVNGFVGSSAHQVTVKFATWLLERPWTTAAYREYFAKYYDADKRRMDWDGVRHAKDETASGMYDFWLRHEWAEHEALLEMEYAKARKLARNPSANVPLVGGTFEETVLEAMGDEIMTGPEIARKSGYDYSYVRDRVPRMVEKGLLEKMTPHGYRRLSGFG